MMAETGLSDSMRQHWDEKGYLVLKQAIPREETAAYLDEADRVVETYTKSDPARYSRGAYTIVRTLERTSGRNSRDGDRLFSFRAGLGGVRVFADAVHTILELMDHPGHRFTTKGVIDDSAGSLILLHRCRMVRTGYHFPEPESTR